MKLTDDQRAALDALPTKRRAYALAYVGEAAGNATEAARIAKYRSPAVEGCRLLKNAQVRLAIESLRAPVESRRIASIEEMQAMLTRILRNEEEEVIETLHGSTTSPIKVQIRDRLKAVELLGKMQGAFVERREISGPNAGPVEMTIAAPIEVVREVARGKR